jgi:hypothetical protein
MFGSYENKPIPTVTRFWAVVTRITSAVCCLGCRHSHLLGPRLTAPHRTENPQALDATDERSADVNAIAGGAV